MSTNPGPRDARFLDEKSVRDELTRVFDLCYGCGRCVDWCSSFPTLFDMMGRLDDPDAGRLTPADQDRVVDACSQCKICVANCPYTPDQHEWGIDFPRLMLRATAMRRATGQIPIRRRVATKVLGRTDRIGKLVTARTPIVTRAAVAAPGSFVRRLVARLTGVSSVQPQPPFATQRFSVWFRNRTRRASGPDRGGRRVTVFPTCLVEYQATQVGQDVVDVYERNGVECSVTSAGCCGAPWLHAGDLARFAEVAERNVRTLAAEVREHGDVIVPQPVCGYVLRHDYVDHVDSSMRADAELVARHTFDVAEYLVRLHREAGSGRGLDIDFDGPVPPTITYHSSGPVHAEQVGLPARDLLALVGSHVQVLPPRSGIDGLWNLRADNDENAMSAAQSLVARIEQAGGAVAVGECHLTNTAIAGGIGTAPIHPIQVIASAYGIPADADRPPI